MFDRRMIGVYAALPRLIAMPCNIETTRRQACIRKAVRITLSRLFPFLRWPRPTLDSLKQDAWAGITVGLVLIPQAIAYATLAGMPPETGLYAALLPSIIGILWGSSPLLAVGPVALTSLLVFGSLLPLAEPGTTAWVALAIWLALYSGLLQFLMGAFRLGRVAGLVSQPVISGFINAAAIIILLSQLPALFGVAGVALSRVPQEFLAMDLPQALTIAFGFGSLALLFALKRYAPRWPGMLLVSALAIAVSWQIDFAGLGGDVVGNVPATLPALSLPPAISFDQHQQLWPAALIIALISFTEAMSSCRVLARKRQQQWDENQELIGQGLAKLASGLSGAFPVSGSFSRSALNLYAGATSAWSTLFSALCIVFALLFLTDLLYYLPRAVLAAMIAVPVFGLFDFAVFRRLFRISPTEGAIAVTTFAVTLISAPRLHWGVFAGIALTVGTYLFRRTQPRIIEVSEHPDGTLRDRHRFSLERIAPDVLAVRMDAALNFMTCAALHRFVLEQCRADERIRRVLLSCSGINEMDASGIDILEDLKQNLESRGMVLYLSAVKKQVADALGRARVLDDFNPECLFATDRSAIAHLQEEGAQSAQ